MSGNRIPLSLTLSIVQQKAAIQDMYDKEGEVRSREDVGRWLVKRRTVSILNQIMYGREGEVRLREDVGRWLVKRRKVSY
jgi:uncharacterized protein YjiS (DUF1127 family)